MITRGSKFSTTASFLAAVVLTIIAGGLLGACSSYSCKYKGKEYHVGDTWTDGCTRCQCPPEGTKSVWCNDLACPDSGTDGANDTDRPDQ